MSNSNDESKMELKKRLADYEIRKKQLEQKLKQGYNETILRELNIVEHHIQVCEERLNGEWFKPEIEEIKILK